MTTKQLLEAYYAGFAKKEGWESVISDNFKFIGGDMTKPESLIGKQAYREVFNRFSKVFTNMRVKEMIIEGDSAFVLAHYDYVFPGNHKISGNVAELWKVKSGKLDALTIFFDTLSFHQFSKIQEL